MKKKIIKVVSSIMLFVFFVGIAPKEYVHELLYTHHDTVHPDYKKGEIVITGKHVHCSFLSFELASFITTGKPVIIFNTVTTHAASYVLPGYCYLHSSVHSITTLRGPPAFA